MAAKVTEADRKKTGIGKQGKFPVNSVAQALSALKLRGHGKGVSAATVIGHVARSKFASNPQVKAALKRARQEP